MREKRKETIFTSHLIRMKRKLKPILPSLREKKRYVAFEVISKSPITEFLPVYGAVHTSLLELLGELGIAKAGIIPLKERWHPEKQRGIIRVNNKYVDYLKASLALIDSIDEEDAIVISIGVSGILKKATNKYLAG